MNLQPCLAWMLTNYHYSMPSQTHRDQGRNLLSCCESASPKQHHYISGNRLHCHQPIQYSSCAFYKQGCPGKSTIFLQNLNNHFLWNWMWSNLNTMRSCHVITFAVKWHYRIKNDLTYTNIHETEHVNATLAFGCVAVFPTSKNAMATPLIETPLLY